MADPKLVRFTYKNHRGEVATRQVVPLSMMFDSSPHHPEKQWLLDAYDAVKGARRTFAMKDVSDWRPYAADEDDVG